MNAISPIVGSDETGWNAAVKAVNAWRGAALQCFAEAEAAVSEMLLLMAAREHPGARVQLRHLIGQRFEDLRSATGPEGPFAKEGKKAAAALATFHPHEALRPFLCHGVMKIGLDQQGHWMVMFKVLTFRGREAERASVAYDRRDAERALAELRTAGKQLEFALQSLRARIGKEPEATEAKAAS